jgi:two-component system chemotaxis response regulator CheB
MSANKSLVLIGGSAGSLDVLLRLLPGLHAQMHVPIVIVLHRKNTNDSTLRQLLASKTTRRVKEVEEKEAVEPDTIYLAPPDYHLLFEQDRTFALDYSEKINYSRPSIDVSFESAAEVYGPELLCILLSGGNADGTEGFRYIRQMGGTTAVQQPDTADVSFMPQHALDNGLADHIVAAGEMAAFINSFA